MHGQLISRAVPSDAIGGHVAVDVYLPVGGSPQLRSIYLLHGRGDRAADWAPALEVLDELIDAEAIPPTLAVIPDAPWSERAGYWVDSQHSSGAPIETAITVDVVPYIDAAFSTIRAADARAVAGYSMGGAGAVRYLGAHRTLFGAAIALSPAVYVPLPPASSSACELGAFGVAGRIFDEQRYARSSYPAAMEPGPGRLFVGFGADEYRHPGEPEHDIEVESTRLVELARSRGIRAESHRYPGGHDWGTWLPAFRDALTWWAAGA